MTAPAIDPNPRFALFEAGFRPFFLLAGLHAVALVPMWVAVVLGYIALSVGMETSWHAHQMVYGFAAAGLAGFLLTAVPGWTGTPPRRGWGLIGLAALWVAGRIAMTFPDAVTPAFAAAVDLLFIPALVAAIAGPLLASGSRRNIVLLLPLAVFWAGDLMMQGEFLDLGGNAGIGAGLGIDTLLLLISIIGGRIVPAFTANALGIAAERRQHNVLDAAAVAAMALFLVGEALTEISAVTGVVAAAAAILNAARLALWRGERALRSPILWVLHLGYLWLVLGLALKAVAALTDFIPEVAALHALTVGAIATMQLAVMTRAALGHTGREIKAHPVIVVAYVLVSVAAVLRVGAAIVPQFYSELLIGAGLAWTVAFLLFLAVYAPILVAPRIDRKPG